MDRWVVAADAAGAAAAAARFPGREVALAQARARPPAHPSPP